jgi:hypothetical protein
MAAILPAIPGEEDFGPQFGAREWRRRVGSSGASYTSAVERRRDIWGVQTWRLGSPSGALLADLHRRTRNSDLQYMTQLRMSFDIISFLPEVRTALGANLALCRQFSDFCWIVTWVWFWFCWDGHRTKSRPKNSSSTERNWPRGKMRVALG